MRLQRALLLLPYFLLPRFAGAADPVSSELKGAAALITPQGLLAPIKELSSDAYAGRLPGTVGEEKSVAYIIAQCKQIGLEPGASDGGWTEKVPLWGTHSHGSLQISTAGKEASISAGQDYVAWSVLPDESVNVPNSDLVFVGHGVIAPEYQWDDYAGVDVHGKTVVILSGDPPVADPQDPSKLDDKMFGGLALTYYGRTGTKLDTAYAHGAVAAILLYSTQQAGANLFQNFSRENMILRGPDDRKRVRAASIAQKTFSQLPARISTRCALPPLSPAFMPCRYPLKRPFKSRTRSARLTQLTCLPRSRGAMKLSRTSTSFTVATGIIMGRSETRSFMAPATMRPVVLAYSS